MTDLSVSTYKNLAWLEPFNCPFLRCLAAFNPRHLGIIPSYFQSILSKLGSIPQQVFPQLVIFRPHSSSRSLAPSLPPTSVAFKNPNKSYMLDPSEKSYCFCCPDSNVSLNKVIEKKITDQKQIIP